MHIDMRSLFNYFTVFNTQKNHERKRNGFPRCRDTGKWSSCVLAFKDKTIGCKVVFSSVALIGILKPGKSIKVFLFRFY
ncbi:hypothetical protein BCV50_10020 [Bacillus subtilis]|nr:hypothetical protein BCV50_10020 [Bacillus subtilis]